MLHAAGIFCKMVVEYLVRENGVNYQIPFHVQQSVSTELSVSNHGLRVAMKYEGVSFSCLVSTLLLAASVACVGEC